MKVLPGEKNFGIEVAGELSTATSRGTGDLVWLVVLQAPIGKDVMLSCMKAAIGIYRRFHASPAVRDIFVICLVLFAIGSVATHPKCLKQKLYQHRPQIA